MSLEKKFTVSASPHVRSGDTVTGIMLDVIIALIPSGIAAVAIFGYRVLAVIAVSVITCEAAEYISRKVMKRESTLGDLSAVVTGLLLAYNVPSGIPIWMLMIGDVFAIVVVKQFFGGLGQNFANPAIVGRIVMLVSFPAAMSNFAMPLAWKGTADAVTTATPLASTMLGSVDLSGDIAAQLKGLPLPNLFTMFYGARQGCIGEVCSIALLIGGIYLLTRRVINIIIPGSFIGTVAVFMLIASHGSFLFTGYELLSGGLLLGAIFMATDYVTSPTTNVGRLIFGIGCGLLTSVIRLYGSLPEGVSYAILLMNILSPSIEKLVYPHPFGAQKKQKKDKEAAA